MCNGKNRTIFILWKRLLCVFLWTVLVSFSVFFGCMPFFLLFGAPERHRKEKFCGIVLKNHREVEDFMKKWILGVIGLAVVLWLASLPGGIATDFSFWKVRRQAVLLTGFVAYIMMAWVMVLSLRLFVVERWMGGLDQVYRLHKWLGIWACILGIVHWAVIFVPRVLVRNGILERPVKPAKTAAAEMFLQVNWKDAAEVTGEWAFYFVLFLMFIALVRKFPYHWFRRLHVFMAPLFLVFTFHALILVPADRWLSPAGALGALAAGAGSFSACWAFFGGIGAGKRYRGIVRHVERLSDEVLHVRCELEYQGLPYVAGQFVFVRFEGTRDPHPFTISSSFLFSKVIGFYIKVLGDDTRYLMEHLEKNTPVRIEGPYGRFDFVDHEETKNQIWIGAGIGVVPFLARLEVLVQAAQGDLYDGPGIHFYYCSQPENVLLEPVENLARSVGVRFEVHDEFRHGALDLETIFERIPDERTSQLWFCGPESFGRFLEKEWKKRGLPVKNFHREYFRIR